MTAETPHILLQAQQIYLLHPIWTYVLVYIGTIFAGNPVVLGAAWLAWLGKFGTGGIIFTLSVCLVAHLSGDQLWYWLGRFAAYTSIGRWVRKRITPIESFDNFFDEHRIIIIAVGKLLAAPVIPLLFITGWNRMPWKPYLRVSVISALIWFPILLGIGYGVLSGAVALGGGSVFITLTVLIAFIVASLLVLHYMVMPRFKKYWQ